ncbi:hypothetical protein O3P69_006258 [Scylla paramamosain]|uniref:Ionotropic glutamate receptor C-terminal domain-containing protein n=1 Tax=Scylla paramamosain TaxID=85552 RepID=A0AAW0U975_SCYPA
MPSRGSARVSVGVWMLTSLIVGAVYRSNLKAMLIIPKLELPFDSMEGLTESGLTTAVIEGTSMHLDVMKADTASTLGQLKENLIVVPSDQQGIALVNTVSGRYALFAPGLALIGVLHLDFSRVSFS